MERRVRKLLAGLEISVTAAACRMAPARSPLTVEDLDVLQREYPFRTAYRYDAHSLRQRAAARAEELLLLPGAASAHRFLELGCMDGLVSAGLRARAKAPTGIDLVWNDFQPEAQQSGATFAQMDAQALGFPDGTFDYAFSYNAFEHFPDPARVLREVARVVRPGGFIFLRFGPLYYSPWGEHAYRTITVPYCHLLFTRDTMNAYAVAHGLRPLRDAHVNGWTLEQYRQLWDGLAPVLEPVQYEERQDPSQLSIVRSYPGCFKGRAPSFQNFVVSHIRVLFRKRCHPPGR